MSSDIVYFVNNKPCKYKGYPATYHTEGIWRYRSTHTRFSDPRNGWMAGTTPLPLYLREEYITFSLVCEIIYSFFYV
jgi:hypothetical protein